MVFVSQGHEVADATKGAGKLAVTPIAANLIGHLLRGGVGLCAWLIGLGLFLSWVLPHPRGFSQEDLFVLASGKMVDAGSAPRSLDEAVAAAGVLDPGAVVSLGLLVLIALPIVRVAFMGFLFLLERDYLYVCITGTVLLILITGLFLGMAL